MVATTMPEPTACHNPYPEGEEVELLRQFHKLRQLDHDRNLLIAFADKLAALGRENAAEWLFGVVFGNEAPERHWSALESVVLRKSPN